MSLESGILGAFFNVDNWAKDILVNNLNYPSVKEVNDIMYCEENPAVMKADLLWAPDNKKYDKYPVILNIHGGGWIIGDKRNSRGMCLQFADSGVFVVNMNYGMPKKANPLFDSHDPEICHSNDYLWPYPVKCAFAALQWIKDNAEKYNLDIDQVYVSGDSAGSNIAAVTQTASNNPAYAAEMGLGDAPLKIAGSLLFCGFYDTTTFWGLPMNKIPVARSMMQDLFDKKDPTTDPLYKTVNPIPYFTKDIGNTLIISGKFDPMTHGQSDMVEARLKEIGVNVDRYIATGPLSLHDFQILSFTPGSHNAMMYVAKWLDKVLK